MMVGVVLHDEVFFML